VWGTLANAAPARATRGGTDWPRAARRFYGFPRSMSALASLAPAPGGGWIGQWSPGIGDPTVAAG
jgi:hypothetical protein